MDKLKVLLAIELFSRSRTTASIGILGVGIMVYPHISTTPWQQYIAWAVALSAAILARILFGHYAVHALEQSRKVDRFLNAETILSAMIGFGWGCSLYVFDSTAMDQNFYLRLMILSGVMTFLLSSTSVFPRVFMACSLALTLTATAFILQHDYVQPRTPILVCAFAYWVMLCVLAVVSGRRVRAATAGQLAVKSLSDDLGRAQAVAHVGSWEFDLETDTMRMSAETCRIFGLPEGTTGSADSYRARTYPDDLDRVNSAWQAALEGRQAFDERHRILVGNKVRWVRQRAELQFREDGTAYRGTGTTQDISEQVESLETRTHLDSTLDAVPDQLFEVGLDGRVYGLRGHLRNFLTVPPEDFLGQTISALLPPEAAEVFMSAVREAHDTGRSEGRQFTLQLRQETTWFELSVNRKPGAGALFIALSRNITERKRAEAALRESEDRYRALVEWSPDPIVVHRGGKLIYVNPAAIRVYGAPPGHDLVGMSMLDIIHPDFHQLALERIARMFAQGVGEPLGELRFLLFDGTAIDAEVSSTPILYAGEPAIFVSIRNVTERKQAEEALRVALLEKEGLLRETHHRVKNNLILLSSLISLEGGRSHEPETRATLKTMQTRIRSVVLLNEMLYKTQTYTQVELGRYLEQIARHSFQAQNAGRDRIRLVSSFTPTLVRVSQAIPCGLIVNELLANSLKHGFPEGRGGEVALSLQQDAQGEARLQIKDTGVGLPHDFDTRRGQSLGLQLVSDLTRQLGGKLEVSPGPGAGFTVTFTAATPHRTGEMFRPRTGQ